MNYLERHLEQRLLRHAKSFKTVLVAGARQVGKSTLLEHVFPNVRQVVFDPVQDLYGARSDPDQFLETFGSPLILDEVQYAPELLPALKRRVDRFDEAGQYFLTGSQNLAVLRNVSESLAGRVGILRLDGLTPAEQVEEASAPSWNELISKNLIKNLDVDKQIKPWQLPKPTGSAAESDDDAVDARETAALDEFQLTVELNKPIHQPHLENFFGAVRGKNDLNCPGEVGLSSAGTVLAVQDAIAQERKIKLTNNQFMI